MKCFLHEALMFWGTSAAQCIIDNTNLARLRGAGSRAVIVPEMNTGQLVAVLRGEGAGEFRGVGGHAVASIGARPVCNRWRIGYDASRYAGPCAGRPHDNRSRHAWRRLVRRLRRTEVEDQAKEPEPVVVPYGIAIVVGSIMTIFLMGR